MPLCGMGARVWAAVFFGWATLTAAEPLAPAEAAAHVGEVVTVRGVVAQAKVSRHGTLFLNFGAAWPRNVLAAVVLCADAPAFTAVSFHAGQTLTITGPVQLYRHRPQILLHTPAQLTP